MILVLSARFYYMAIWHCSGEKCLEGACFVQGAKNAVLPILAASVVCPTETDLLNVPQLSDVEMSLRILRSPGVRLSSRKTTFT